MRAAKYVAELVRTAENEINQRDRQLPFTPSQRQEIRADCERRAALLIDAETGLPELVEALEDIGRYQGEGGPGTPWREIVRDVGATARAALSKTQRTSP